MQDVKLPDIVMFEIKEQHVAQEILFFFITVFVVDVYWYICPEVTLCGRLAVKIQELCPR